jgi:putative transposase
LSTGQKAELAAAKRRIRELEAELAVHRRAAGIQGPSGRPRYRKSAPHAAAMDRVGHQFEREAPDQLWVTDITEHPTREGKVYCAVVLDTYSRRVVGWSIDASPTAAVVTNALGMAFDARRPTGSTVIHGDSDKSGAVAQTCGGCST